MTPMHVYGVLGVGFMLSSSLLINLIQLLINRDLKNALNARDILMGYDDKPYGARVVAGGTLVQTFERPIRRIRVTSKYATELKMEYDH